MDKKGMLTGLFSGVALGAVLMPFVHEFFTFPFFHNSNPGMALANVANELLLPIYNGAGALLGIGPQNLGVENLPTVNF